jgi:FkbM family methyltransferase
VAAYKNPLVAMYKKPNMRKLLRTTQSYFPALKEAKDNLQHCYRTTLKIPHEQDFRIISRFNSSEDVFIDVGANHGQSINSILLFRPDARIISFEANSALAKEKLHKRYAGRSNIQIHSFGLSDAPGEFTLYVPSYNGFVYDGLASLDRKEATEWLNSHTLYRFDPSKLVIFEVPCRVETLDAMDLAPSFIKLDVQGWEYHVLLGGQTTLARTEPVLLVEDYQEDPRIKLLLEPYGYREYHLSNGSLVPGLGKGPNTFLLTERRVSLFR